ncbi:MAG TPA: isoprenylcysteine carboxylmethyltransferase family protein [Burkholderiales bacterium]|nr:isoprenylcysteine carboxylmethyltransferase family protein [Burkholderiales bacterium]
MLHGGERGQWLVPIHAAVYLVMVTSMALIVAGVALLAIGWAALYRGRGGLVTGGIYRHLRHPQYLGLILVVVGLNLQWPTLLTLVLGPSLIVMYVLLARLEGEGLASLFGIAHLDYEARTPAFIPRVRGRRDFRKVSWSPERSSAEELGQEKG